MQAHQVTFVVQMDWKREWGVDTITEFLLKKGDDYTEYTRLCKFQNELENKVKKKYEQGRILQIHRSVIDIHN